MITTLINVLVALLFAAFAIGTILFVFAVAGKVFTEIMEGFQRSTLEGIGVLSLSVIVLLGVVFGVHFVLPYVMDIYHSVAD